MLGQISKKYGIEPKHRGDITIFLGEPESALSGTLSTSMRREGFLDVRTFPSMPALANALTEQAPDLLMVSEEMPDGNSSALIKNLREGRVGSNPFVPTIVTAWNGTASRVRKIIDSGSDDLVINPASPEQLLLRMGLLAQRRKPFIATSDYIGPERRSESNSSLPRIAVPNTLQAKALGRPLNDRVLQQAISAALRDVNEGRLKQHGIIIGQLVGQVVPAYRAGIADEATLARSIRLRELAKDAMGRLRATAFAPVAELCAALHVLMDKVVQRHPNPGTKELALLPRVAEAIVIAFSATCTDPGAAEQISHAVSRFLRAR